MRCRSPAPAVSGKPRVATERGPREGSPQPRRSARSNRSAPPGQRQFARGRRHRRATATRREHARRSCEEKESHASTLAPDVRSRVAMSDAPLCGVREQSPMLDRLVLMPEESQVDRGARAERSRRRFRFAAHVARANLVRDRVAAREGPIPARQRLLPPVFPSRLSGSRALARAAAPLVPCPGRPSGRRRRSRKRSE